MGNVQASVQGPFQRSEYLRSRRRPLQADVEQAEEWSWSLLVLLDKVVFTGSLGETLVGVSKSELGENSSRDQESGAVGSSVVGETKVEAKVRELLGVSRGNDNVVGQSGVNHLASDVLVGKPNDQAILWSRILVLVLLCVEIKTQKKKKNRWLVSLQTKERNKGKTHLDDKTLSLPVVGLSASSSLELDLVALEVSLVLDHFHERHGVWFTSLVTQRLGDPFSSFFFLFSFSREPKKVLFLFLCVVFSSCPRRRLASGGGGSRADLRN